MRSFSCAEQYRAMAFAQLTYRESLRDLETCLLVQPAKLYGVGFREPVRRAILAGADEGRDWRIYAKLAQHLIGQARRLYAKEGFGIDLDNAVYALDSTTIDLCMSIFPWARFRPTKAAVKMHTLLDLRGNIPSFVHVSDGKMHDGHALLTHLFRRRAGLQRALNIATWHVVDRRARSPRPRHQKDVAQQDGETTNG